MTYSGRSPDCPTTTFAVCTSFLWQHQHPWQWGMIGESNTHIFRILCYCYQFGTCEKMPFGINYDPHHFPIWIKCPIVLMWHSVSHSALSFAAMTPDKMTNQDTFSSQFNTLVCPKEWPVGVLVATVNPLPPSVSNTRMWRSHSGESHHLSKSVHVSDAYMERVSMATNDVLFPK